MFIFCGGPHGVNLLDWDIIVSEFKLQYHYWVPFQINTFVKDMNPLSLFSMGQIAPLLSFNNVNFGIK